MLRRLRETFFSKPPYGRHVSVLVHSPHTGPPARACHHSQNPCHKGHVALLGLG